jgi:hypothetical protein
MLIPFRLTEDALTGDVDLAILLEKIQDSGAFFSPSPDLNKSDLPSLVRAIPDQETKKEWMEALENKTIRNCTCPDAPLNISTPPLLTDLRGCELLILGIENGASFELSREDPRCDHGKLELILSAKIGSSVKMKNAKEAAFGTIEKGTSINVVWDKYFAPWMRCASKIQVFDKHAGPDMLNDGPGSASSIFRLIKSAFDLCEEPHIEIYTCYSKTEDHDCSKVFSTLADKISSFEKEMCNSRGPGIVDFYVIPKKVGDVQTYHDRGAVIDSRWVFDLGIGLESHSKSEVGQDSSYHYYSMPGKKRRSMHKILDKWKADAMTGNAESGCWTNTHGRGEGN